MQKYLLIALGGALGSMARFLVGSMVADRAGTKFPYGTFAINITACLILGFSMTFFSQRANLSIGWRFLVPVGFIGSYSTFSTFEWEVFANLQGAAFLTAALYVGLSVILGLLAVWCGVLAARMLP